MKVNCILQSTTLLLVALLVGGELTWRACHPSVGKTVDENSMVKNIRKNISDRAVAPDVLVVGSSLSYCFTYDVEGPDKSLTAEPEVKGSTNCAPDKFMSKLLQKRTSKPANVQVIALPGAMASDITNIITANFAGGKKPKTVVYLAAPRDFVDKLNAPKKTPLIAVGGSAGAGPKKEPGFQEKCTQWMVSNVPPSTMRRIDAFREKPTLQGAGDVGLNLASNFFEQRSQLRTALTNAVCDALDRDVDLWHAQHNARAKEKAMTHFDHDLGDYQNRYNPPDFDRLSSESRSLTELADACKANGCKLIVVNMPLTKENKALVDAKLYQQYKLELSRRLSTQPGIKVYDTDQFNWDRAEFLDSAHLNTAGSRRLQQMLAPEIATTILTN